MIELLYKKNNNFIHNTFETRDAALSAIGQILTVDFEYPVPLGLRIMGMQVYSNYQNLDDEEACAVWLEFFSLLSDDD